MQYSGSHSSRPGRAAPRDESGVPTEPVRPESSISNCLSPSLPLPLPRLLPAAALRSHANFSYFRTDFGGKQRGLPQRNNVSLLTQQLNNLRASGNDFVTSIPTSSNNNTTVPHRSIRRRMAHYPAAFSRPDADEVASRKIKGGHHNVSLLLYVADTSMTAVRMIKDGLMEGPDPPKPFKTEAEKWAEREAHPTMTHVRFNQQRGARAGDEYLTLIPQHRPEDLPRLNYPLVPVPTWFDATMRGEYTPTLDEALESLPLCEMYRLPSNQPHSNGVLKIRNVPYLVTKAEIMAFIGSQARVIPQPAGTPYYAVHIIVERETGKTMNCFIEFNTAREASHVERHILRRSGGGRGRAPKIGDRPVIIEPSSIEELMAELFPRAKNVRWNGITPIVDTARPEYYPGQPSAGFQGFLHPEELAMMAKFADDSQKVSSYPRLCESCLTCSSLPSSYVLHIASSRRSFL